MPGKFLLDIVKYTLTTIVIVLLLYTVYFLINKVYKKSIEPYTIQGCEQCIRGCAYSDEPQRCQNDCYMDGAPCGLG